MPLLDSILGAGPELVGGNFDTMLRSDYSSASYLYTGEMLHGIDTFGSIFRIITSHDVKESKTTSDLHVFTRDSAVRHPSARHSFALMMAPTSQREASQQSVEKDEL